MKEHISMSTRAKPRPENIVTKFDIQSDVKSTYRRILGAVPRDAACDSSETARSVVTLEPVTGFDSDYCELTNDFLKVVKLNHPFCALKSTLSR
ncbi:hypothetical protein EVAR_81577_1 [Eumeta japonica]|uniref:Uncharacterized protein n=1 Tax=Eumeta variegata TaxID=151549 RepID=A0A4C1UZC1_EUMVA|nr:hypothetical protein EVAR_81577_1 [Eumeta japonica]